MKYHAGELPRENMKSSHVKDPPSLYIYLINRAFHSQKKINRGKIKKNIKVKWFGLSLVFM